MLRLINIKKSNGMIAAEYDPENTHDLGYVKLNTSDWSVIELKLSKAEKGMPWYLNHVRQGLEDVMKMDKIPDSFLVMWY